jgi:hypothetical protein
VLLCTFHTFSGAKELISFQALDFGARTRAEMSEGEFWNNLGSFVDKKRNVKSAPPPTSPRVNDRVGSWLKTIPKVVDKGKSKNVLETTVL